MNKEKILNEYSTCDLALAAVISIYYPFRIINKENSGKVYFIFQKDKNFDLLLEQYWCGDLKIEPKQYFNSIKILKSRIYQGV